MAATVHGSHPTADFSVKVRNTGSVAGSEVVQLYLEYPSTAGEPPLVLRAFRKTRLLAPGEDVAVELSLSLRDLAVWSPTAGSRADGGWQGVSGRFGVVVGSSSRDERLRGAIEANFH